MEVDLCIVSFNTQEKLKRLLDTLCADYEDNVWNLVVADNGSTDGTVEFLKAEGWSYPIDKIFYNSNIGYANACNQLAAEGDSEIVGLLNADVWLTTKDVSEIARAFEADPELGIVGPKQRDERNRITHGGIFGTHERPRHRGWQAHDPEDRLFRDCVEAITVSGSAYFVRRSVWNELTDCPLYQECAPGAIGAFLPTNHYYEETWCSYHAWAHLHKVEYLGAVSIGHSWHSSAPVGQGRDKFRNESQAMFRTACRHHDIPCD